MEVMDLCKPCVCAIEAGRKYRCREVKGGVDNKIRCERCQCRRYGKTYRLEEQKDPGGSSPLSKLFREIYSPEVLGI